MSPALGPPEPKNDDIVGADEEEGETEAAAGLQKRNKRRLRNKATMKMSDPTQPVTSVKEHNVPPARKTRAGKAVIHLSQVERELQKENGSSDSVSKTQTVADIKTRFVPTMRKIRGRKAQIDPAEVERELERASSAAVTKQGTGHAAQRPKTNVATDEPDVVEVSDDEEENGGGVPEDDETPAENCANSRNNNRKPVRRAKGDNEKQTEEPKTDRAPSRRHENNGDKRGEFRSGKRNSSGGTEDDVAPPKKQKVARAAIEVASDEESFEEDEKVTEASSQELKSFVVESDNEGTASDGAEASSESSDTEDEARVTKQKAKRGQKSNEDTNRRARQTAEPSYGSAGPDVGKNARVRSSKVISMATKKHQRRRAALVPVTEDEANSDDQFEDAKSDLLEDIDNNNGKTLQENQASRNQKDDKPLTDIADPIDDGAVATQERKERRAHAKQSVQDKVRRRIVTCPGALVHRRVAKCCNISFRCSSVRTKMCSLQPNKWRIRLKFTIASRVLGPPQ